MLLSLIIPIYKVEDYIIECIESVCCQLCEGIEVIIVNDGTPDNSMLMARDYIQRNYNNFIDQFIFIDQENQGQSVARNNALKVAKGDYIAFLDSDDYLLEGYFRVISDSIQSYNDVDVIHFNARQFNDVNKTYLHSLRIVEKERYFKIDDHYRESIFKKSQWYPWLRILKKSLFDEISFEPNVYMEDKLLFPELYYDNNLNNILDLEDELVCYRHRNGSSIRSGYNKALLNGIDLGLVKFSSRRYKLYSIVYIQFLIQKLSIMAEQGHSIADIYKYLKSKKNHIDLSYSLNMKTWLLKKISIIYVFLLILKKR